MSQQAKKDLPVGTFVTYHGSLPRHHGVCEIIGDLRDRNYYEPGVRGLILVDSNGLTVTNVSQNSVTVLNLAVL